MTLKGYASPILGLKMARKIDLALQDGESVPVCRRTVRIGKYRDTNPYRLRVYDICLTDVKTRGLAEVRYERR